MSIFGKIMSAIFGSSASATPASGGAAAQASGGAASSSASASAAAPAQTVDVMRSRGAVISETSMPDTKWLHLVKSLNC